MICDWRTKALEASQVKSPSGIHVESPDSLRSSCLNLQQYCTCSTEFSLFCIFEIWNRSGSGIIWSFSSSTAMNMREWSSNESVNIIHSIVYLQLWITSFSLPMSLSLFRVGDDWLRLISEWLEAHVLGLLDVAISNEAGRASWLKSLRSIQFGFLDNFYQNHSSIRWLILRGANLSSIKVKESTAWAITSKTFEGICMPSLRNLNLGSCDELTDDTLAAIALGCSQLLSIKLRNCIKITDKGIRALSSGCRQLQKIGRAHVWTPVTP